ncbi:MAG: DUF2460 domain-containing protein [Methylocystis sp.]
MTLPTFPTLPGQTFATKSPITATNVAEHDSGRAVRTAVYQGLYEFEVGFDGLASDSQCNPGLGAQSLQAIMGLYLQCGGSYGAFLYVDPNDNAATNQTIATGDGATTQFTFLRSIGAGLDSDFFVTGVTSVAVNGALSANWSLVAPNVLAFASPPASGAAITASFTYAFVCRFLDDSQDFENFMQNLWAAKSIKFRSVRQ